MNREYQNITEFIKGAIVAFMLQGFSSRKVAEQIENLDPDNPDFSISYKTCQKVFNKWNEPKSFSDDRKNNGKKPKYNEEEQQEIALYVVNNQDKSLKDIMEEEDINPKQVSISTFKRILKNQDLKPFKQPKIIFLNNNHIQNRLSFSKKVKSWTDNWKRVVFTDECQLTCEPSYQKLIWCESKEQINNDLILAKERHPLKVHIQGSISYSGSLQLTRITGKMDSDDYLEILQDKFDEQEENWNEKRLTFQQDNSPVHTAGIISEFLVDNQIEVLDWPSKSPDLSPIENVWSLLRELVFQENNNYDSTQQ